ncbi:MAG: 50S ribosomal protein L11 methyltransferase [Desulfobulbaceae bacterium]|nr:50S ribosomal protein L11 methyltransferase [Desulfobulbaceae bacterium]
MATAKKWLKITYSCPERLTEAVSDLLGVLSGSGVEIHPVEQNSCNEISGFFALPGSSEESRRKRAAVLQKKVSAELAGLFAVYGMGLPEPAVEILADQAWATSWQQYFKAFEIAPGLVIKPSWETYSAAGNQLVLEMDPGMAFGTGQHESTRLALALLSFCFKNSRQGIDSVLDVGTGTGILAMAAALFGARHVEAIDNDPEAVTVAQSNIRQNNLTARIALSGAPLAGIRGGFDLVCANIVHDVLVEMAPQFKRLILPGGRIILAGILTGAQEKSIVRVYEGYGMLQAAVRTEGEWAGILLHTTP